MEAFAKPTPGPAECHGNRSDFGEGQSRGDNGRWPYPFDQDLPEQNTHRIRPTSRSDLLTRVIATEILPRLAAARRPLSRDAVKPEGAEAATTVDTDTLVAACLTEEAGAAALFTESLRRRGVSVEDLYLGVITETARALGVMWDEDRCDFVQVTIGLGRLQQIVRGLSPAFQAEAGYAAGGRSILLASAAGEQHTFGLIMVAEFFQRAGWRVEGGPRTSHTNPALLAGERWLDAAGFSISADVHVKSLTTSIRQVRRESLNRSIVIMVGGPAIMRDPGLTAVLGADFAATDAPEAVRVASAMTEARSMA